MADGVAITAGAGTTVATDDVGGVHFQRVKATWGVDGTATDVSATNPMPVTVPASTATGNITTQNLVPGGTATAGSAVEVTVDEGSACAIQVTGTYTGALSVQGTVDGAAWITFGGTPLVNVNTGASTATITSASTGIWQTDCSSFLKIRVTALAAVTGTATVTLIAAAGTAAVALDTAIPPGTNDIGGVFARRDLVAIRVASAGLTTATTAYTAGDQVGTQFTVANAARASGGTGTIVGVTLTDKNDIIGAYDVVFTNQSITLASDNAAYAISDADSLFVIGIAQLAGSYDIGNNRVAQAFNLAIPYDCVGTTSLFASLIVRTAHTFFAAVTDLQLAVYVERN